ncbi:MAG TPA: histidine kinase [Rubrobacteraceae bacterium]|nr:histidine kinase [Rubrobacteraceae bacterium]
MTESTKEQGRGAGGMVRRAVAWLAWSLVALSVALLVGGIALARTAGSGAAVELTYGSEAELDSAVITLATVLIFSVVGAIIASRHPRNTIGWIFCGMGLLMGLNVLAHGYVESWLASGSGIRSLAETAAWFGSWSYILLVFVSTSFMLLLFPDGRLPSPRWRPVAWSAGLGIAGFVLGSATEAGPLEDFPQIANPYGFDSPVLGAVGLAGALVAGGSMVASVISLIVRMRRAGSKQRQQIKWLAYGGAVVVGTIFVGGVISIWKGDFGIAVIAIALLGLPIFTGIAIVKHRLYDIDLIINRTLVYGALTASVVGMYVFVVGYLGVLFQTGGNFFVSLLATGIVAILFQPLRDRLQRAVNHLMYGERDDPYNVLSRLGQRLETVLAPDAVLPTIAETVREALKLPYAAVTLPRDGRFEVSAASGEPPAEPLRLPLSYQGETVGELLLAPRALGEEFSAADRRLLNDLAHHAGVAVHGVRVMADLRRSRERLVLAREEERRRLRRDLHDELAPTLAALGLAAATVGELIPADPKKAAALNAELQSEIRSTVGEVRRLVYDLRPPTLDELGLAEAIRQRAARYNASEESGGLQITVESPGLPPELPAAVEVAAYRIVQEALMNVVRHAEASSCAIRLACPEDRALEVEVTDNGVGLPESPEFGVGLRSMRERAAELGGSCVAENAAPAGTRVFARLPLAEPAVRSEKEE